MKIQFANNAVTRLAAPVTAGATSISVTAGTGALFPVLAAAQGFNLSLTSADGTQTEVTLCTAVVGDVLTVTRAQEGTTAKAFAFNDFAANLATAGTMRLFPQGFSDQFGTVSMTQAYAGNPNGHVAGSAAVVGVSAPSLVYDTTDSVLWICTTSGTTTTAVWSVYGAASANTWCGTSTGSANAQIFTTALPIPPLSAGNSFSGVAGFTNTAALTVNVSGSGVVAVYKDSPTGPIPLTGGEWVAGNIVSFKYDGTRYQLTATELGTAALANASSNTGTLAAVLGATTVARLAAFSDTTGTVQNGPAVSSNTGTVVAVSGATVAANLAAFSNNTGTVQNGPAVSSNTGTVAAVSGAFTVGHLAVAADVIGTIIDGGPPGSAAAPSVLTQAANNGTTLGPGVYNADTTTPSGGAFNILLPAAPAHGACLVFNDSFLNWGKAYFTISRNGHTIAGAASDLICNQTGFENVQLTYNLPTLDWKVS